MVGLSKGFFKTVEPLLTHILEVWPKDAEFKARFLKGFLLSPMIALLRSEMVRKMLSPIENLLYF